MRDVKKKEEKKIFYITGDDRKREQQLSSTLDTAAAVVSRLPYRVALSLHFLIPEDCLGITQKKKRENVAPGL